MSVFQKVLFFVLSTFLLFSSMSVFAQKKLRTGMVTYEIINVETSVPELKLMKGAKTSLYFDPEKQKIDIDLNNESVKVQTFYYNRNDKITVLYDVMGKYFKVNSNFDDRSIVKPYVKNINYLRSETKNIAGYQCYKAEISFEDEKLTLWITDRIKLKNPDFQSLFPGLEGFPLEYIRRGDKTKMTFKAIVVKENIPNDVFQIPRKYDEISEKEFKQRMGGMKFGF